LKRKLLVCTLVLLTVAFSAAAGPVRLRFGSNAPINSPTHLAQEEFARLVVEKTNGEVIIEVFPANQLGGNRELIEAVKMGAIDLELQGSANTMYLGPEEYAVMRVPFIFRDQEHVYKVLEGPIGQRLIEQVEKSGVLVLNQRWDRLPRHVSARVPIRTPEDMQNLKIRNGDRASVEGFRIIGAAPVNIPLNEMYLALQQGVADGANLPLDYFWEHSIYEVNKYLNLLYQNFDVQMLLANARRFNSLSPEHQQALLEAAEEAAEYNNKLTWESEADYAEKLAGAGMEVIRVDMEPFYNLIRERVDEIYAIYPSTKGFVEEIDAVQ
jgi:tripartite ATP-independent transporter DctP family solute receptor